MYLLLTGFERKIAMMNTALKKLERKLVYDILPAVLVLTIFALRLQKPGP